ncbi:MAG TPA: hypothetical protein VH561_21785 [Micromonosporaceae bacterium]
MTPELAAAAAVRPVGEVESAWTTDPGVLRRARALALNGWSFYLAGRAGVLGDDVHPETLAAALGTVAPDALRTGWDAARPVGPSTVAAARLAECARWGTTTLAEVSDNRLADLLTRVVGGADAVAMPVFAATRAMVSATIDAAPTADSAQVALLVHALAEHRAGAMLLACRALGLRPVEVLIAGPEGEQEAITCGWSPPFPPRISVLRRYTLATALADRITGCAYAVLDAGERVELVDRLTTVAAAVANCSTAG